MKTNLKFDLLLRTNTDSIELNRFETKFCSS